MKNLTKNIILILGALFIFTMPSYSLDLKNSPEDCTFIINNVNNEQTKELAYYYRGQYYYENGEYSKAVSDFTESIKRARILLLLFIFILLGFGYNLYQNRYHVEEISYKNITNTQGEALCLAMINSCADEQFRRFIYRVITYQTYNSN